MLPATTLLLLGSMLFASVHGLADLNVTLALDDGELTGTKLKPVNDTFGSHRYYIPGFEDKWINAVVYCAKLGGSLTDIRSREELVFLKNMSKKSGDGYAHWVGAAAIGDSKAFVWILDQTTIRKEFWLTGQPKRETGNCVFFKWNSTTPGLQVVPCNTYNRPFICKFPAK